MKSELPPTIKGRSSRTVFFPIFSSFFVRKTAKAVKQETFPKFGNETEGKVYGTLRIPIQYLGKRNENMQVNKCAKNKLDFILQIILRYERPQETLFVADFLACGCQRRMN